MDGIIGNMNGAHDMRRSKIVGLLLPPPLDRGNRKTARIKKQWNELQVLGASQAKLWGIRDDADVERLVREYRRKRG